MQTSLQEQRLYYTNYHVIQLTRPSVALYHSAYLVRPLTFPLRIIARQYLGNCIANVWSKWILITLRVKKVQNLMLYLNRNQRQAMTLSPTTKLPLQEAGFRKWEWPWRQRWRRTRKTIREPRKDTKRSVCVVWYASFTETMLSVCQKNVCLFVARIKGWSKKRAMPNSIKFVGLWQF